MPKRGNRSDLNRRRVLKNGSAFFAAGLTTAFGSVALSPPAEAQTAGPPHIIYIVSDDQGWKDVGFNGSDILTPNLDALAGPAYSLSSSMPCQCARPRARRCLPGVTHFDMDCKPA